MLKQLAEYGKFVEIDGFKKTELGDPKAFLEAFRKELPEGVEVQLFNADLVATWQHLYFAALNALQAFKNKCNLSKSLAVETALYASGQRQIKKAIDLIGLKPDSANIAALLIGDDSASVKNGFSAVAAHMGIESDDTVLSFSEAKRKQIRRIFDVSNEELEAVTPSLNSEKALVDLIIERVALLSTRL